MPSEAQWDAITHAFPEPFAEYKPKRRGFVSLNCTSRTRNYNTFERESGKKIGREGQFVVGEAGAGAAASAVMSNRAGEFGGTQAPASGRHVNVAGRKASTHAFVDPAQWSPASSSQTPAFEDPMQIVVAGAKASAGHAPDVPVHVSATSH